MTCPKALAKRAAALPCHQQEASIRAELSTLRSRYRDAYGARPAALREALAYADEVEAHALELLTLRRALAPGSEHRPEASTS
jgi:hypothetical protein